MLVEEDHAMSTESHQDRSGPHPLDRFVPDPTGMRPLCDEHQFAAILEGMVADAVPRLFAVVQEYGQRVDARIVAWGMAFEDHAEVASVSGQLRMGLQAPEEALHGFHFGSHVRARLVWFNPDAVTPSDDEDDEDTA